MSVLYSPRPKEGPSHYLQAFLWIVPQVSVLIIIILFWVGTQDLEDDLCLYNEIKAFVAQMKQESDEVLMEKIRDIMKNCQS